MSLTIAVNDLSLCHKGSSGVSTATVPDVCKTPPGPVPIPYPNIAKSSDLANGSTTVAADGGNMCAIYGSEFSLSTGDEAGTVGGVKSGTIKKEATWLTYSFDVKIEGKAACRLTDKMFHNHGNTVNMAGVLQPNIMGQGLALGVVPELQVLCEMMCDVKDLPGRKQNRIAALLKALDAAMGGTSPLKAEVPFDPLTLDPYQWIPGHRRPDVVITNGGPPVANNIRAVVEMKFKDGATGFSREQRAAYDKMFGDKLIPMEEGVDCVCEGGQKKVPQPVPVPVRSPGWLRKVKQYSWYGAAGVLALGTVAALLFPLDGPFGEAALGSATAAAWARAFQYSQFAY